MKNLVITDTNVLVSETGSRLRRGEGDAAGGRREGGSEPLSPGTKKWRERGNSRRWKGSPVADGGGGWRARESAELTPGASAPLAESMIVGGRRSREIPRSFANCADVVIAVRLADEHARRAGARRGPG